MKRVVYVIVMLYYLIMCVDLFVQFLPITINVFSSPFVFIGMLVAEVNVNVAFVIIVFLILIISLILFTSLAHFYNGKFIIIPTISLILLAIGNIPVIFEFPTVLICAILIIATTYTGKKGEIDIL
ncbi:MAG: hypothetical protein IJA80_03685 [Clostridia bacterium]|nr:hypothetical protein [Clostridia bacterium]